MIDYDDLDATDLAARVRSGDLDPADPTRAALARLAARNPTLNAFAHIASSADAEDAACAAPDGPFRGVPFLVKDLVHPVAGMPFRSGSAALRDLVPDHDADLIARYRDAGLVVIGKTSTPEFGLMGTTEPEAFGPTRNPWAPGRSSGGSSGGAAAAVASRIVPMADASDGGGSIRIPASFCGLFGLKPTRGRVPEGPDEGEAWHGASASLAVTRSVRDAAALLDAVCGPALGDPVALPRPTTPFADEVGREPGRLRIGVSTRSPIGTPVDPACVRAAENAAETLAGLGHDVELAEPQVDGRALATSYFTMYFGIVAATLLKLEAEGRSRRHTELTTRFLGAIGDGIPAARYVEAWSRWNVFGRAMGRFHATYDLYLTPTVAALPSRIGAQAPSRAERALMRATIATRAAGLLRKTRFVDQILDERLAATPFTQLANLTGLPAMSVPLHHTEPLPGAPRGLPVGVQFVARPAEETLLLRLAAQLEDACPWADRRPEIADLAPQ